MIGPISERLELLSGGEIETTETEGSEHPIDDFGEMLAQNIEEVNQMESSAQDLSEQFALGEIDNIHEVTVATEKARLALQLTTEIQNRVIEAHDDIMRMQI